MERNLITLAGTGVTFGPFQPDSLPDVLSMDWVSEVACAVLGGGNLRLIRLVHAIRTGVEAGVIRSEHLGAIERAAGCESFLDFFGSPYAYSATARRAVAWVVGHERAGHELIAPLLSGGEQFVADWTHSREACPV